MEHRPHIHLQQLLAFARRVMLDPQRLLALACLAILTLNVSLAFYVPPFSEFLQEHWKLASHPEGQLQTFGMILIVLAVLGLAAYAIVNLIVPGTITPYDSEYEN